MKLKIGNRTYTTRPTAQKPRLKIGAEYIELTDNTSFITNTKPRLKFEREGRAYYLRELYNILKPIVTHSRTSVTVANPNDFEVHLESSNTSSHLRNVDIAPKGNFTYTFGGGDWRINENLYFTKSGFINSPNTPITVTNPLGNLHLLPIKNGIITRSNIVSGAVEDLKYGLTLKNTNSVAVHLVVKDDSKKVLGDITLNPGATHSFQQYVQRYKPHGETSFYITISAHGYHTENYSVSQTFKETTTLGLFLGENTEDRPVHVYYDGGHETIYKGHHSKYMMFGLWSPPSAGYYVYEGNSTHYKEVTHFDSSGIELYRDFSN